MGCVKTLSVEIGVTLASLFLKISHLLLRGGFNIELGLGAGKGLLLFQLLDPCGFWCVCVCVCVCVLSIIQLSEPTRRRHLGDSGVVNKK